MIKVEIAAINTEGSVPFGMQASARLIAISDVSRESECKIIGTLGLTLLIHKETSYPLIGGIS